MRKIIKLCFLGLSLANFAFSDTREALPAPHQASIFGVDISPDGKTLATASFDGTVRLWDIETGALHKIIFPENLGKGKMLKVKFNPQNNNIIIAGFISDTELKPRELLDSSLYLYDIKTEKLTKYLEKVAEYPSSMCISKDGNLLAMGSNFDGEVKIWELNTGKQIMRDVVGTEPAFICGFDEKNNLIIVTREQIIKAYDLNGNVLAEHKTKRYMPKNMYFSGNVMFNNENTYFLSHNSEYAEYSIFKLNLNDYTRFEEIELPYGLSKNSKFFKGFSYNSVEDIFYIITQGNMSENLNKNLYILGKESHSKCDFNIDGSINNTLFFKDYFVATTNIGAWGKFNIKDLACQTSN